jgi:hypothetical protein
VQGHRVGPRVAAEQPRLAAVGLEQPEQDAQRRGLAGAVGSEEAGDLARRDGEIEAVEGMDVAETLGQAADGDGGLGGHEELPWCDCCWSR